MCWNCSKCEKGKENSRSIISWCVVLYLLVRVAAMHEVCCCVCFRSRFGICEGMDFFLRHALCHGPHLLVKKFCRQQA